jgi:hypothetical protein
MYPHPKSGCGFTIAIPNSLFVSDIAVTPNVVPSLHFTILQKSTTTKKQILGSLI